LAVTSQAPIICFGLLARELKGTPGLVLNSAFSAEKTGTGEWKNLPRISTLKLAIIGNCTNYSLSETVSLF